MLLASFTAWSQTPPSATSPELKAALLEMMDAINLKQAMNQMAVAMTQSMPQMMARSTEQVVAKLPTDQQEKARASAKKSMETAMSGVSTMYNDPVIVQGMEEIMTRAYARRFTLAEIRSITSFYQNDAGKKMLTSAPQLMQDTAPEIMALMSPRMSTMIEKITKEVAESVKMNSPGTSK